MLQHKGRGSVFLYVKVLSSTFYLEYVGVRSYCAQHISFCYVHVCVLIIIFSTLRSGFSIIVARMSIAKRNRMGVQESDQNWMAEGCTIILLYMLMMMWHMDGTWNY